MVTISATASEDKTQNCVVTPKKKAIAATSNLTTTTASTAATNSTSTTSSGSAEANADQMAPNILVYKKVSVI
jgi:regulator of G-protein signaling